MKVLNARDLPGTGRHRELPEGAVLVDRTTPWGNPYRIGQMTIDVKHPFLPEHPMTRQETVDMYRAHAMLRLMADPDYFAPLYGAQALVCWCDPDACHAGVIAELIEEHMQAYQ